MPVGWVLAWLCGVRGRACAFPRWRVFGVPVVFLEDLAEEALSVAALGVEPEVRAAELEAPGEDFGER